LAKQNLSLAYNVRRGGRQARWAREGEQMAVTSKALYAGVRAAVEQGLVPRLANGEAEYLQHHDRVKAVLEAADKAGEERVPYAWEVTQNGRKKLVSAAEFTRTSYDYGEFKPLYE
jgi:hypothetical protein